jgi:hypothetical protein
MEGEKKPIEPIPRSHTMRLREKNYQKANFEISEEEKQKTPLRKKKLDKVKKMAKPIQLKEKQKIYHKTEFEENFSTFLQNNMVPKFEDLQNVFQKFLEMKPVICDEKSVTYEPEQANLFRKKYDIVQRCLDEIAKFEANNPAKYAFENKDRDFQIDTGQIQPPESSPISNHVINNRLKVDCQSLNIRANSEFRDSNGHHQQQDESIKADNAPINKCNLEKNVLLNQKANLKSKNGHFRTSIQIPDTFDNTNSECQHSTINLLKGRNYPNKKLSDNTNAEVEEEGLTTAAPIDYLKTKTYINCDIRYFNFSLLTSNLGSFDGILISNIDGPSVAYQGRAEK